MYVEMLVAISIVKFRQVPEVKRKKFSKATSVFLSGAEAGPSGAIFLW